LRKHKRLFLALNFEVAVITVLLLNVGFDYLISDIAAAAAEIATSPKMASPILTA
jgi:hypothetical protein